MSLKTHKFPPWLHKRLPPQEEMTQVRNTLKKLELKTVCQEAHCPNICECFAGGTATFMILGDICSRNCRFCAVRHGNTSSVDPDEPRRVAEASQQLGLDHVVVTSVTRDDLPDGGSGQFARTICAVRERCDATIEVLTPDFLGQQDAIDRVIAEKPDVYNHNVETVPRLYPEARPQANYRRSLGVLERAAKAGLAAKSGLMLGLGETIEELQMVFRDLRDAGCRALTLGQYLAPSEKHHPIVDFVPPKTFENLRQTALEMGFWVVASGPFVRSSYNAGRMAAKLQENVNEIGQGD
ncbi:MAG: lipoyl synthase [Planctomycetes bacterium]|nr:lipoyl synthase [Planctomycetota bacterium]